MKKKQTPSYFAFGEHWNEFPEYTGYLPVQYQSNWHILKDEFRASGRYGFDNPLPLNIKKDGNVLVVNLYGFKIPEGPLVASFGTDATVGRVALCKTLSTKEYIAIAW